MIKTLRIEIIIISLMVTMHFGDFVLKNMIKKVLTQLSIKVPDTIIDCPLNTNYKIEAKSHFLVKYGLITVFH
ncbi:MAG: hypothetical protein CL607_10850 [Anaerolineaceae bacterium]|nr:hypothetical protein [Anaerolineaceae bacterium]